MNTEEKIEASGEKKREGNALFKAGKYVRSSKRYEKGEASKRKKIFIDNYEVLIF